MTHYPIWAAILGALDASLQAASRAPDAESARSAAVSEPPEKAARVFASGHSSTVWVNYHAASTRRDSRVGSSGERLSAGPGADTLEPRSAAALRPRYG